MPEREPTREDLLAVAALLPAIVRVEAAPGEWRGGEPTTDGAIQMPYFDYVPDVSSLITALYQRNITLVFDWGAWQYEARRFLDEDALKTASLEEVRRLLTLHVRKDRFVEGHLGGMVRCGHIAALLRRLGELAAAG
jgi:hypothetical protein